MPNTNKKVAIPKTVTRLQIAPKHAIFDYNKLVK